MHGHWFYIFRRILQNENRSLSLVFRVREYLIEKELRKRLSPVKSPRCLKKMIRYWSKVMGSRKPSRRRIFYAKTALSAATGNPLCMMNWLKVTLRRRKQRIGKIKSRNSSQRSLMSGGRFSRKKSADVYDAMLAEMHVLPVTVKNVSLTAANRSGWERPLTRRQTFNSFRLFALSTLQEDV